MCWNVTCSQDVADGKVGMTEEDSQWFSGPSCCGHMACELLD